MGGKTAIALGLVAGLLVGGLIVGGVMALAPLPGGTAPPPSAVPSAIPTAVPSAIPSSRPASPSAAPASASGSAASLAPSASPQAFGIGQPAPHLVVPTIAGRTAHLAGYRGAPV